MDATKATYLWKPALCVPDSKLKELLHDGPSCFGRSGIPLNAQVVQVTGKVAVDVFDEGGVSTLIGGTLRDFGTDPRLLDLVRLDSKAKAVAATLISLSNMSKVSCVIGAGYSHVAGMPLAKDLLTSDAMFYSRGAKNRIDAVHKSYKNWLVRNPDKKPEEFLSDLYNGLLDLTPDYVPFRWAAEVVMMVLATLPLRDPSRRYFAPRYIPEILSPTFCPEHTQFWKVVTENYDDVAVITTSICNRSQHSLS